MDTTQAITHLGLCAGYGGIELGLKRVLPALRTVALCEIEAFACANLVAKMEVGHMDPAPIWTDLKSFPWADFRDRVDILTGGYPSQPFSAAGNRLGKDDPRHLWPFIADGIRLLRPKLCFFENVDGHISLGLREVVEELEELGYTTTWGIFSASEVGAPHRRKRVFILAYRNGSGLEGCLSTRVLDSFGREESSNGHFESSRDNGSELAAPTWPAGPNAHQYEWEPPRVVGDSEGRDGQRSTPGETGHFTQSDEDEVERQIESPLGRNIDECPDRMDDAELFVSSDNHTDELRLLGNGVVPATAERAFRVLMGQLLGSALWAY